ncbi:sulfite exporter TauE/SafE family protein [Flammeovirgaceae bacterium SG7u.111]|nr:sulfite exporter TauE/SafE family protein [Flammeovirgaceae bacterium SG7u.132]WPO37099.1 sulfite exporter TauE/SafE family protein [Flammeovirgaceae bacterium SG7u.111]
MDLDWYYYFFMLLAGVLAGAINTLAGSGSVITLSILIFAGLPADIANGTNRIGTSVQSMISGYNFYKGKQFTITGSLHYTIPALLGAIVGAMVVVDINEKWLEYIIGIMMMGMLLLIIFKPHKKIRNESNEAGNKWVTWLIFAAIGFYGGFIQAGIGIFLMMGLSYLTKLSMVQSNAVKVFTVALFSLPVLCIFIYNDQVNWELGIWLAVGQAIGSYSASKFALNNPNAVTWMRKVLIVMIVVSIIRMFGVWEWVVGWV